MNTKRERILEKARKLFAMAQQDASPNEAEIAMRQYTKLMESEQITAEELENSKPSDFDRADGQQFGAMPSWYKFLGSAVADVCDVRVVLYRKNYHNEGDGSFISFEGMNGESATAIMMLDYLVETMKRGLKNHLENPDMDSASDLELGITTKRDMAADYRLGFVLALCKRGNEIAKARKQAAEKVTKENPAGQSLMVVKRDLIEAHFGKVGKARPIRTKQARSAGSRNAGAAAGNATGLNNQVGGSTTRLLS